MPDVLSEDELERFVSDGFVCLSEAFPRELADECRAFLWRETGLDPVDPATWTQPVVRLPGYGGPLFQQVVTTGRLHSAFDQLVGPGRWVPRTGIGTFPIRFPHPDDPGDAGWHLDAGFGWESGDPHVNLRSDGRGLLLLFLFSDVDEDSAPTRIKVGSHLDVPRFLADAGQEGVPWMALCQALDAAGVLDSPGRPLATATGRAGDVYLCHPFLIHAAQQHHGTEPRFLAQPGLDMAGPLELDGPPGARSPVERAILLGLGTA